MATVEAEREQAISDVKQAMEISQAHHEDQLTELAAIAEAELSACADAEHQARSELACARDALPARLDHRPALWSAS